MSFENIAYAGRTTDFTVLLYEDDGSTALVLANADVVRVKIGRAGSVVLDLDSAADTANGSGVTVDNRSAAQVTVRLAQGDTSAMQGTYDVEVLVVDASETSPANAVKACEYGCMHILPSQSGDTGLT